MRDQRECVLRYRKQTVFEIDQGLVGVQLVLPDVIQISGDVLQRLGDLAHFHQLLIVIRDVLFD